MTSSLHDALSFQDSSDPERKSHLMKLKGGRTWNYLYRKYFPLLRTFRAAVYVAPLHDKVEAKVPSIASESSLHFICISPSMKKNGGGNFFRNSLFFILSFLNLDVFSVDSSCFLVKGYSIGTELCVFFFLTKA